MTQAPLHDAFGSLVDPEELLRGLDACGLPSGRIVAHDSGVIIELPVDAPDGDAVALALTWMRARLSPIIPVEARETARLEPDGLGARYTDRRGVLPERIVLAECTSPDALPRTVASLAARLPAPRLPDAPVAGDPDVVELQDPGLQGPIAGVARAWAEALVDIGRAPGAASVATITVAGSSVDIVGRLGAGEGAKLLVWFRPGGPEGVAPAMILAASNDSGALRWLAAELSDPPVDGRPSRDVILDGLVWGAPRRPIIAALPDSDAAQIRVDDDRCDGCGDCATVCPTGYLDTRGKPTTTDPSRCVRCFECVDLCHRDALRPSHGPDTYTSDRAITHRDGWLSRLRGAPGPVFPAAFPPSWLRPAAGDTSAPRVILGLAVMTMQEHAAALIVDGQLVGAVEEEKLVRIRHYGWRAPGRPPFITPAVDPTLCLEEVLCRRSVRVLLHDAGLTLDDVDVIAVNGLHGRFRAMFSLTDTDAPIPFVRAGRVAYVPHHLSHAASAFRLSGADAGWVFTVDGRGDRETAAMFEAVDGDLRNRATLLSLTDRSIGGVYEGFTRLLGFGSHGQGSVMALAGFGTPRFDLSPYLSIRSSSDFEIHESGINEAFANLARTPDQPITKDHHDLAASLQDALEQSALALVGEFVPPQSGPASLTLAGGVTLNCHMNQRLRTSIEPERVFAQPGANDGGTAIGAGAEALWELARIPSLPPMAHALLGPRFDEESIARALRRRGLAFERPHDLATAVAASLAQGSVFCWFQGNLEFGPRALGARSIIADPRSVDVRDRVNDIKTRERWRPFGPSILAGHESEWFETAFDSRFMLFTLPVVEERRDEIPAVVHVDGTTRPQSVHADTHPEYHAMISAFHALTGVPMVLNTSFNRRGEPIVCTPDDAIDAFVELGADALAIGPFIAPHPRLQPPAEPPPHDDLAALASLPGGRRLSLRLTTQCDLNCGHCMLRDTVSRGDRSTEDATHALAEGRREHCDELVILRGEAPLRSDLADLVRRARGMGYRTIQLQAHGASLADRSRLDALIEAGVTAFEMQLLAGDESLHDALAGAPGSFKAIATAVRNVAASGTDQILVIPILRQNRTALRKTVLVARKLGVSRVQFLFPRPVELQREVVTSPLVSLSVAAAHLRQAADYAASLGMSVTTEGFPLCTLDAWLHGTPDATEDFSRHRIDDLAVLHDERASSRSQMRPQAAPCRTCSRQAHCPKTWSLYLELNGSSELVPFHSEAEARG